MQIKTLKGGEKIQLMRYEWNPERKRSVPVYIGRLPANITLDAVPQKVREKMQDEEWRELRWWLQEREARQATHARLDALRDLPETIETAIEAIKRGDLTHGKAMEIYAAVDRLQPEMRAKGFKRPGPGPMASKKGEG